MKHHADSAPTSPQECGAAAQTPPGFDYSTPEAQAVLAQFSGMAAELRSEYLPLMRKVRLYEVSLGLAVIPLLLRRALIVLGRQIRMMRR